MTHSINTQGHGESNRTMKVKVKICGIKTLETAQAASAAGADFLGFNLVPESKRFIKSEKARKIIGKLPKSVMKVGVFRDADISEINNLIDLLGLDYIQLHGDESPKYINSIQHAGIIKTFSLPFDFEVEKTKQKMKSYKVDYFLLDREVQGKGELLNPVKVRELSSVFPIILAGGLTTDNISEVIERAKPQVIDVAGGVEINGEKDEGEIIKFMKEAKSYAL